MNLINLTPHPITIIREGAAPLTIEPSGTVARAAQSSRELRITDNIHIVETVYGEVEGLPAPVPGTYYLVSGFVMSALAATHEYRSDVLKPEDFVRDEKGNITGCRALSVMPK